MARDELYLLLPNKVKRFIMFASTFFLPVRLKWSNSRTYLFIFLFVAGNLVLPQLCHLVPSGGRIFLPVYFFTLIAAYKFGVYAGLATAILSPLANYFLFGMPMAAVLPAIMIKSCLLAAIAAYTASATRRLSLFHLLGIMIAYQFAGSLIEWGITQSFSVAAADFTTGLPGMCIQVVGGWLVLKTIGKYDGR